jgi:Uma2 family endonuclease
MPNAGYLLCFQILVNSVMIFPLTLRGTLIQKMSDKDLERFSRENKPYKIEKESDGALLVREPAGYLSSRINSEINRQLANWNFEFKLGEVADSSGGFTLPNHAIKSPDASWKSNERIQATDKEDLTVFIKICPDFVIELKSKTDSVKNLKLKMKMWIENGARLGWLIDPDKETIYIFSNDKKSLHRGFDLPISGEPVLPKFELVLSNLRMK